MWEGILTYGILWKGETVADKSTGGLFGGDVSQLVDAGVKAYALYQDMTGKKRAKTGRPRAREPWRRQIDNYSEAARVGLPVAEALWLQTKGALSSEESLAVVAYVSDNTSKIRTMDALPSSKQWVVSEALTAFGASEDHVAEVRRAFDLDEFLSLALQAFQTATENRPGSPATQQILKGIRRPGGIGQRGSAT